MITDANIREYLLGRLDSDAELVESIDEQILTDPEFSISVDVIEDEIIEEYLEGSLNSEDTRAVERHFLRPPERQRKLKTARLFSRYLEAESRNVKTEQPAPARSLFKVFRVGWALPSFRTCAEIAASAVFVISILTLLNQRRELDIAIKQVRRAAKSGAPAFGGLKSATAERFTVVATNSRDAQPRQARFTAWETGPTRGQGEFRNQVAPRRSRTLVRRTRELSRRAATYGKDGLVSGRSRCYGRSGWRDLETGYSC